MMKTMKMMMQRREQNYGNLVDDDYREKSIRNIMMLIMITESKEQKMTEKNNTENKDLEVTMKIK